MRTMQLIETKARLRKLLDFNQGFFFCHVIGSAVKTLACFLYIILNLTFLVLCSLRCKVHL